MAALCTGVWCAASSLRIAATCANTWRTDIFQTDFPIHVNTAQNALEQGKNYMVTLKPDINDYIKKCISCKYFENKFIGNCN